MKDDIYIKTRLDNLRASLTDQTPTTRLLQEGQIEILSWVYQNGSIKTIEEIKLRKENLEEEVLALEFAEQITCPAFKILKLKIMELEIILREEKQF